MRCDRQARAEAELTAQFMLGVKRSFHPGEYVLNFGRESAQRVAVSRQSHATCRTGNQRLADDFLKSPKVSGDCRLRQMQLLCRRRNLSTLRDGQERSEKPQVKVVWVHNRLSAKHRGNDV